MPNLVSYREPFSPEHPDNFEPDWAHHKTVVEMWYQIKSKEFADVVRRMVISQLIRERERDG